MTGHGVAPPSSVEREAQKGGRLYQVFNGFGASTVTTVRQLRTIPPVVVAVGELVGLIYRSEKGQAGKPRNYIHFFEDRPQLVSNADGTQLYIVGGSYQITRRGIEG